MVHVNNNANALLSFLVACSILVQTAPLSSSINRVRNSRGRSNGKVSSAIEKAITTTPKVYWGAPSFIRHSPSNNDLFSLSTSTAKSLTSLHMALGGNYLDNIDIDDDDDDDDERHSKESKWGFSFGPTSKVNRNQQGGSNNRRGGGVGTAIRNPPSNNYGIGRDTIQSSPSSPNGGRRGGMPRVFAIKQPQDLLDFVIEDEKLSVGKLFNYMIY